MLLLLFVSFLFFFPFFLRGHHSYLRAFPARGCVERAHIYILDLFELISDMG